MEKSARDAHKQRLSRALFWRLRGDKMRRSGTSPEIELHVKSHLAAEGDQSRQQPGPGACPAGERVDL